MAAFIIYTSQEQSCLFLRETIPGQLSLFRPPPVLPQSPSRLLERQKTSPQDLSAGPLSWEREKYRQTQGDRLRVRPHALLLPSWIKGRWPLFRPPWGHPFPGFPRAIPSPSCRNWAAVEHPLQTVLPFPPVWAPRLQQFQTEEKHRCGDSG